MRISKSKYVSFCTCPKNFYLQVYKKELEEVDEGVADRYVQGHIVGEWATKLFDNVQNVMTYCDDGKPDYEVMAQKTSDIVSTTPAIAEATFTTDNLYCQVDILQNNGDGSYDIFEVKSSASVKEVHYIDVAFQKFVLESCGVKVRNCYVVHVNNKYERFGEIEPKQLFTITNVNEEIEKDYSQVADNLKKIESVLSLKNELNIEVGSQCKHPYICGFYKYCHQNCPSDIDLLIAKKKNCEKLSARHNFIASCNIKGVDYVDKQAIKAFLEPIKYPIYFFDFETYNLPIPQFNGIHPYQQIPFQYSIHVLTGNDDKVLEKHDYLANVTGDPRAELVKCLLQDIKDDGGTIISYNMTFEKTRIKELAQAFPKYEAELLALNERMIDLYDVFKNRLYYKKEMETSFSIKSVLPALFPNNKTLDYKSLIGVQHGSEASSTFLKLKTMSQSECETMRENLINYCSLDTYAMVKIYQHLCEITK